MVDRRVTGDVTLADLQHSDDPWFESADEVSDDDGTDGDDDDAVDRERGFVADDARYLLHKEGVQVKGPSKRAVAERRGEFVIFEARTADPYTDPKTGKLKPAFQRADGKSNGGLSPDELRELDEAFGIADSVNGAANAAVDSGAEKLKVAYFKIRDGEFKGEQVQIYFFRDLGGHWDIEFEGGRLEDGELLGGQIRMVFMEGRIAGRSIYVSPKDLEPLSPFAKGELDKHLRAVVKEKDKSRIQREAAEAKAKAKLEAGQNAENGLKRGGDRKSAKYVQKKKQPRIY